MTNTNSPSHLQNRYMLSVFDNKEFRWIRHPFMTKNRLNIFMFDYVCDPERYERLEIYMEPTLNTNVYLKSADSNTTCTLREYIFGSFYQETAEEYECNEEYRKMSDSIRN